MSRELKWVYRKFFLGRTLIAEKQWDGAILILIHCEPNSIAELKPNEQTIDMDI